jgi:hypothetical protein
MIDKRILENGEPYLVGVEKAICWRTIFGVYCIGMVPAMSRICRT